MIWGKTIIEKNAYYWDKIYCNKWFAWYPVQLVTEQWVWWQFVMRKDRRTVYGKHWEYTL